MSYRHCRLNVLVVLAVTLRSIYRSHSSRSPRWLLSVLDPFGEIRTISKTCLPSQQVGITCSSPVVVDGNPESSRLVCPAVTDEADSFSEERPQKRHMCSAGVWRVFGRPRGRLPFDSSPKSSLLGSIIISHGLNH